VGNKSPFPFLLYVSRTKVLSFSLLQHLP